MRKIWLIILGVLICSGCAVPRTVTYPSITSIYKETTKVKGAFGGNKITEIKDFRENISYEGEIIALKTKAEKFITEHPDLSDAQKSNLRELKVTAGSTKDEIRFLLGEPLEITAPDTDNPYQATELWIYKLGKKDVVTIFILPVFFVRESYYLYFKDNALAAIERRYLESLISTGSPVFQGTRK